MPQAARAAHPLEALVQGGGVASQLLFSRPAPGRHTGRRGLGSSLPPGQLTQPEAEENGCVPGEIVAPMEGATVLNQLEEPLADHEMVDGAGAGAVGVGVRVVDGPALPHRDQAEAPQGRRHGACE